MYLPEKYPLTAIRKPTTNYVMALSKAGTIYGCAISDQAQIVKSENWGDSWSNLAKIPGQAIVCIEVLDDDSLLFFTYSGAVYRSTDGGATALLVLSEIGYGPAMWNGISRYGNLVFFAPYNNNCQEIYMSTDFGVTWKKIFDGSDGNLQHCHCISFDPYENLLWTAWGDNRPKEVVMVSDDFGSTWQVSENHPRVTNIIPLPDCVLFGSDEKYWMGVYRHVRPEDGTFQSKLEPKYYWAARKNSKDGAPDCWATRPAVVYGENGVGFWGYKQTVPGKIPSQVYASDGHGVRTIWTQESIPNRASGADCGTYGVYGPDASGNLLVDLRSEYDDGSGLHNYHILKLSLNGNDVS